MKKAVLVVWAIAFVVFSVVSPASAGSWNQERDTLSFSRVPLRTVEISGDVIIIKDSSGRTFHAGPKDVHVGMDEKSSGTYADIIVCKAGEDVGVFKIKHITVFVRTSEHLNAWATGLSGALVYSVLNRQATDKLQDVVPTVLLN